DIQVPNSQINLDQKIERDQRRLEECQDIQRRSAALLEEIKDAQNAAKRENDELLQEMSANIYEESENSLAVVLYREETNMTLEETNLRLQDQVISLTRSLEREKKTRKFFFDKSQRIQSRLDAATMDNKKLQGKIDEIQGQLNEVNRRHAADTAQLHDELNCKSGDYSAE
ncbi:hypothetical protein IQ07DRAFT_673174, partial [Pyrenochaeta sp. DS3sAY3a]